MNRNLYLPILFCLLLSSCLVNKKKTIASTQIFETRLDSVKLFDQSRNRVVPVALYFPQTSKKITKQKVVIFSHGYGANKGGDNLSCSYLNENLASHGYFVASIQHELPTDSLLPTTGIPQIVRRTNWERGVENILFTLNELKRTHPDLDYKHLILIGHSSGGDMSMLFGSKYPDLVDKIISLDNRRVAFPRTKHPRIYSLRSSDQPADEGVLPTPEEQTEYSMKIIKLNHTIHNDMNNNATEEQRKEINNYILDFLNDQ
jgi:predicted esterase